MSNQAFILYLLRIREVLSKVKLKQIIIFFSVLGSSTNCLKISKPGASDFIIYCYILNKYLILAY